MSQLLDFNPGYGVKISMDSYVIKDYTLKPKIGVDSPIHRVCHFSQNVKVHHVSVVSSNLSHQRSGHPSFHVLKRFSNFSHSFDVSRISCNIC